MLRRVQCGDGTPVRGYEPHGVSSDRVFSVLGRRRAMRCTRHPAWLGGSLRWVRRAPTSLGEPGPKTIFGTWNRKTIFGTWRLPAPLSDRVFLQRILHGGSTAADEHGATMAEIQGQTLLTWPLRSSQLAEGAQFVLAEQSVIG